MKKSRADRVFDAVNVALMIAVLFLMLYPIYFTVIASFSEPSYVATGKVTFWVCGFTLDAYRNVFENDKVWTGYGNTLFYTVAGTLLNLALTIPAAYVLSKKHLRGRTLFSWYFAFTMYFSGGLIPSFLVVRDLGLLNSRMTLVVLNGLSVYNMIVTRVYYQTSIPGELYEAAEIDGCGEFGQFFRVALPLSAPIVAVMALFYAVARWNDYFTGLVYISDSKMYPLQLVLRNILIENRTAINQLQATGAHINDQEMLYLSRQAYLAEAMKYALIFIASLPLLVAYPFVQKHFVKGVMIGAVKG
ncbi:MAG: carbohydrate ABC transporter permease [Candidatus Faecivicinus sp.]|nr:carbohydrate ABC transporter permease [Candidatus Faecivicinus sp.]